MTLTIISMMLTLISIIILSFQGNWMTLMWAVTALFWMILVLLKESQGN